MKNQKRVPAVVIYALSVLIVLGISLAIFTLVMKPPSSDLRLMTLFLLITALISGTIGYFAYRLGWLNHLPSIGLALVISYVLSSALTFFNVWLTARLMFASQHDLLLATVLLVFAAGMAVILGFFLSSALTDRVRLLERAAHQVEAGDLAVRVPVNGQDEVARLSASFNQMAAQLEVAAQQQQEVEQLRSDLIAWVGHDLQTPLASIRAILEALADGVVEDPESVQRYLQTAQKDVRALSLLIDDLFQMAQIDAGGLQLNLAQNSIRDLISETLESFSALAKKQEVTLLGSADQNVDPIWMDAGKMGRVLNNLVNNALLHTPPGGTVELNAHRTGSQVEVTVKDSGEGIQPDDLPKIFERFYRSEKSRSRTTGGAGLGLAIAKGIVEAHGGEIEVESEPGKGTQFKFRLP